MLSLSGFYYKDLFRKLRSPRLAFMTKKQNKKKVEIFMNQDAASPESAQRKREKSRTVAEKGVSSDHYQEDETAEKRITKKAQKKNKDLGASLDSRDLLEDQDYTEKAPKGGKDIGVGDDTALMKSRSTQDMASKVTS